jgi:hypothetical protein
MRAIHGIDQALPHHCNVVTHPLLGERAIAYCERFKN